LFVKEKGDYNLLLSDVVLPGESGFYLSNQLLARKPDLKVLLSSGYTMKREHQQMIKSKGFHFLQKPFTPEDLLREVGETLFRE